MREKIINRFDFKKILFVFITLVGVKLALDAYFDYHQASQLQLTFSFAQNSVEDGDIVVGRLKSQAIFEATFAFFILLMSSFTYYIRKEMQKLKSE